VKTYVINQCGKFCIKVFLHYIDIAVFALGYFILPHPVEWRALKIKTKLIFFTISIWCNWINKLTLKQFGQGCWYSYGLRLPYINKPIVTVWLTSERSPLLSFTRGMIVDWIKVGGTYLALRNKLNMILRWTSNLLSACIIDSIAIPSGPIAFPCFCLQILSTKSFTVMVKGL